MLTRDKNWFFWLFFIIFRRVKIPCFWNQQIILHLANQFYEFLCGLPLRDHFSNHYVSETVSRPHRFLDSKDYKTHLSSDAESHPLSFPLFEAKCFSLGCTCDEQVVFGLPV